MINNQSITKLKNTKFLGVVIASDLSWNQHISLVLNKISKTTGIVSKVRHLLPCNLTRHLYLALVQPYISYCNIVWSRCQSSTQLDKILKIQKKYCRLITFSNFRAHSYPLFKQLRLLTVYQIYQYQLALFMYCQMNHLVTNVRFTFQTNSTIHDHFTRQHDQLHLVKCRTSKRQFTVIFQGPKFWNSLPASIRDCPTMSIFRKRMKLFLLS